MEPDTEVFFCIPLFCRVSAAAVRGNEPDRTPRKFFRVPPLCCRSAAAGRGNKPEWTWRQIFSLPPISSRRQRQPTGPDTEAVFFLPLGCRRSAALCHLLQPPPWLSLVSFTSSNHQRKISVGMLCTSTYSYRLMLHIARCVFLQPLPLQNLRLRLDSQCVCHCNVAATASRF